jgi:hypothetical protein
MNDLFKEAPIRSSFAIGGLIIGGLITYHGITHIPGSAEFAGPFIALGTLMFFAFFYVITLAISFFIKESTILRITLQCILYLLFLFMCLVINGDIDLSTPKTKEEIKRDEIKETIHLQKKYDKLLKHNNLFYPNNRIVTKDKESILSTLKKFLACEAFPISKHSEYHSKFRGIFNRTLEYSDSIEINSYRKSISDSLTIDFICYSPNLKYLFVILTYNLCHKEVIESNAFIFLGEKDKSDDIRLYLLPYQNYYGEINKKYSFYHALDNINTYGISFSNANPLYDSYWKSHEFDVIKISKQVIYRYQIEHAWGDTNIRDIRYRISLDTDEYKTLK